MTTPHIMKSIAVHILYDFAAFAYFSIRGHMLIFLKAKISVLKGFPRMLRKRSLVQGRKVVRDQYLWQLLDTKINFPCVLLRLKS